MEVDRANVRKSEKNIFKENVFDILGSLSVPFTMKMRGVPFEAGEKEVFDVK
jgi:hypothetical protein